MRRMSNTIDYYDSPTVGNRIVICYRLTEILTNFDLQKPEFWRILTLKLEFWAFNTNVELKTKLWTNFELENQYVY